MTDQGTQRRRTLLMVAGLAGIALVIYVSFIASGMLAARA